MEVSGYRNRSTENSYYEINKSFTKFEKLLCQFFTRFEIRGKKGRTVPVILTPAMILAIDLLNETREKVGINPVNKYIFARPYINCLMALRAHECLKQCANECGTAFPQNITSTLLRKHIATMSQILNLSESEMDQLANFMGHDLRIHRSFYRLPDDALQLAKVSRVLLAFDRGQVSEFQGENLEEINIDPESNYSPICNTIS